MTKHTLFYMWGPFRQDQIDRHMFYVDQARARLLSRFENIDEEADRASNAWVEARSAYFDPDIHDPSDIYDGAFDAGLQFYELLSDMRERTRLSVVAGMYHEWDKQFREWVTNEVRNWCRNPNLTSKLWSVNMKQIIDLFECIGYPLKQKPHIRLLEACRLVVNVYKHGAGQSFETVKRKFPEYLLHPLYQFPELSIGIEDAKHTQLRITDQQFQEFVDAIVTFWQDIPEYIFDLAESTVPAWFEDAMNDGSST